MNKNLILKSLVMSFAIMSAKGMASVTIAHVENAAIGYFVDSGGVNLVSTGEVSFGFFTGATPTSNDWQNLLNRGAANAWGSLLSLGYTDVRTLGTLGTGFDPSFATGGSPTTNIGATIQNVPIANLASGTRLYVFAFNAGTWDNTSKTATFGNATEWGAVSAWGHSTSSQNFVSPADNGTKSMNFKSAALTSSDVLAGSLVSSANGVVAMVPEPSTGALMMIGTFGLLAMRRLRKV